MSFDFTTLITDRAQADVARLEAMEAAGMDAWTAEELAWFNNAVLRGSYGHTDLNRVGEALRTLSELLAGYGYAVAVSARTDWAAEEWPTVSDMDAYLADVAAVRGALDMPEGVPEVPARMSATGLNTADGLTVQGANDIEQILVYVEMLIQWVVAGFARSNAFAFRSGSRPLPSAKSDLGRTWAELDAMGTGWRSWQAATWYLLLYGNLKAEGDVV